MVDLARIAGLSQLSPQGFLGSGFNLDSISNPASNIDFSQYEAGFREYQKQNPLGPQAVGLAMQVLPGGLKLYDTGQSKQFRDYMQSIGDDSYNQYVSGGLVENIGTPTPAPAPVAARPAPAPVAQTPLPIVQPSVNVQNTGDMKMAKTGTSSLGGDGVTETITRTAPAPFAEPFLQYGMSEALRQYQQGPQQYYPGEAVVGFAPQTEQALRMREQQALAGTPVGTCLLYTSDAADE